MEDKELFLYIQQQEKKEDEKWAEKLKCQTLVETVLVLIDKEISKNK